MDALADFKNGPSIDKLKPEAEKIKDEEYDKKRESATPEKTQELKKKTFDSLYGVKKTVEPKENEKPKTQENTKKSEETEKPKENEKPETQENIAKEITTNLEEPEKQENKLKIDENPNSPLIDGFVKQRLLTVEEGEKVKEALIQEGDLAKTIGEIDGLDSEKQTQITRSIKYLDGKDSKKENLENFNKDFAQEIEGLKTQGPKEEADSQKPIVDGKKEKPEGGKKGEKELVGQNKDLIEKLGGNYFPIGKQGSKENKNDAQDLAFKRTLNQLMEGKNFKRPETFEQMKDIVKNPELDFLTRFQELCKIDTLINNDQSIGNKKLKDSFENGEKIKEKTNLSLEEQFAQFKQTVESSIKNNDFEKLKALAEEGKELKKEIEKPGEVFEGGDIDKLLAEIQDKLKEEA